MSIYAAPNTAFESVLDNARPGTAGAYTVAILDGAGGTVSAPTGSGIVETAPNTGVYVYTGTAPGTAGQYVVEWTDGTVSAADQLNVITATQISVVSGSFAYDPSTTLGKVRLEAGDTDSNDVLFTDTEINVYLTNRGNNVLAAAADLCDVLATRYARSYDFETDQQKFSRSQLCTQFTERAIELRKRAGGVTSQPSTRIDGYTQDVTNEDASTSASSSNNGRVRSGYFNDDVPY